jgi:hypothetical protein
MPYQCQSTISSRMPVCDLLPKNKYELKQNTTKKTKINTSSIILNKVGCYKRTCWIVTHHVSARSHILLDLITWTLHSVIERRSENVLLNYVPAVIECTLHKGFGILCDRLLTLCGRGILIH